MRVRRVFLAAVVLAALLPWSLAQDGGSEDAPVVHEIRLRDFEIVPSTLEAGRGDFVALRVANEGTVAHNLLIEGDYPDTTEELPPGAVAWLNFTATEVGDFDWRCTLHPERMTGTFSVEATAGDQLSVTVDASRLLLTMAAILGLGFLGFLVFDRFRIADTLFLIAFGVLLSGFGLLDTELFRAFQPLVAGFALLIIMLDAGLDLRFRDLAQGIGWGVAFSTIGFCLTMGLVGALAHYVLGLRWTLAFILGCAVTDTAGLIILPIVSQLGVPGKVKTALLVETSLPDVYSVTLVLVLMDMAQARDVAVDVGTAAGNILGGFALTLLVGLVAGIFWIRALGWLAKRRYAYMMTLAVVLGLNWGVGALGGSGPIAVLAFGLVIGNRVLLGKWSKVEKPKVFTDMTEFNGEVAFFVRSFFFVYLGLVLDLGAFTPLFIGVSLALLAAIVAARTATVYLMTARPGPMREYRRLLIAMLPRGTTAAVVSTLPATRGIAGTEAFAAYAVVIIMLTNLIFTVGLFLFFRKATHPAPEAAEDAAA